MAFEYLYGKDKKNNTLATYRKQTAKSPAIAGINRQDDNSYLPLYRKGPVILDDLRTKIGEQAFFTLLRSIIDNQIANTLSLKTLLTKQHGAGVANWLDWQLQR